MRSAERWGRWWVALVFALAALPLQAAQKPRTGPRDARSKPQAAAARDSVDPSRLAPPLQDPELRLAMALALASGGAVSKASALLQAAVEPGGGGRLEQERARLAALAAAREAWLAGLADRKGKLKVELDGVLTLAQIESYSQGELTVARGKRTSAAVQVEEIPIARLFEQIKDPPENAPRWIVPYALLLGGSESWDQRLAADDPEAQTLRTDAVDFPRLLHLGRAVGDLVALGSLELLPGGGLPAERAQETVERVARLVNDSSDLALVIDGRDDLRRLARLAQAALYDSKPGFVALAGSSEWLDEGVLRVRYDFERAEEVDDFTLDTGYIPQWHASMTPVEKPAAQSYFIVKQGAFFGDGQLVYRHALRFGPGVRVEYELRYIPRPGDPIDVGVVMIGLADDGEGGFAAASEFGDVYAIDPATGYNDKKLFAGERKLGINKIYKAEARLAPAGEGFRIEAWRDGEKRNELSTGPRTSGGLFLFVHSPRIVAVESMLIEGVPEAESLAALRSRWVDARVSEMGF